MYAHMSFIQNASKGIKKELYKCKECLKNGVFVVES